MSGTCIGALMASRRDTSLELYSKGRERRVVCRPPQYYGKVEELFLPATECTVHEDNDVRQAEIHTVEPLVPGPSAFEFELAIGKLKNHKSLGTDQIPAELIKAGGRTTCCAIHKLIISFVYWTMHHLDS